MRILIADDSRLFRRLLRSILETDGHVVIETTDGPETLAVLESPDAPPLALIDWMMPGLDGIEVCRRVRAVSRDRYAYLILITAKDRRAEIVAGLQSGADDYIPKPFDENELLARVQIGVRTIELHNSLASRVRELERANQELDAFSRTVAHDLKNPAGAIESLGRFLADDYGRALDDEGREHVQMIVSSAERMREIIDDLMNLSRASRGELRRLPVALSALAQSIFAELKRADASRRVELLVTPALRAEVDERLVRIALENLLRNAWKFSNKKAGARIQFGCETLDGESVFFVRDNGAGFDMSKSGNLFKVFQRLHSEQDFSGTGIGLTIVQRIIERHGGRIWAEAAVNRGATFYFTLSPSATAQLPALAAAA